MINHDRLTMADEAVVANSAMKVVDTLQRYTPEVQLLGLAASFLLLAKHHKQNPNDLFLTINNIIHGVEGKRPEFAAVEMYMENEL